jgi:hypothetical protein
MLKVTLRKATKLRSKLLVKLTEAQNKTGAGSYRYGVDSTFTANVSVYDASPIAVLDTAREKYLASTKEWAELSGAYLGLRLAINAANHSSGISELLTRINSVDAELNMLRGVATALPREADELVVTKTSAAKDRLATLAANTAEVQTYHFLTDSDLETIKSQVNALEKTSVELHDEVERLNSVVELAITDELEEILKKYNLV